MIVKSLCPKVAVTVALALAAFFAVDSFAQIKPAPEAARQAGAPVKGVDVKLTDARGQPVRLESLPPDARAQVERVRKAAESLLPPSGSAEKIKVTVSCTFSPLHCTITVSF